MLITAITSCKTSYCTKFRAIDIEEELQKKGNGGEFAPSVQDYGYLDPGFIEKLIIHGLIRNRESIEITLDDIKLTKGTILKLSRSYTHIFQLLQKEDKQLIGHFMDYYVHGLTPYCFPMPLIGPDSSAIFYLEFRSGYKAFFLEMIDEDAISIKPLYTVAY